MGVHAASAFSTALATTTIVTTAETVAAIVPPINGPYDNAAIMIVGFVAVTLGGGATALQMNIKRGTTIAGTAINRGFSIPGSAGQTIIFTMTYADNPGNTASQQYCLTVLVAGASANSTIVDACILAFAL